LLTLVGTGGIGKTVLATELAQSLMGAFAEGSCVVELASAKRSDEIFERIAAAAGTMPSAAEDTAAALLRRWKGANILLMLDNCEDALEALQEVVEQILAHCAGIKILATSREPLRALGESLYRVGPLARPAKADALTAATALEYPAIAMFADRASMKVRDADVSAIAEIVARLDGIPLAIELAARQLQVLDLESVLSALRLNLDFPAGTAVDRQATMRATIDWGYGALSSAERELFHWLSVFSGGWTLDAAERIGNAKDGTDVLERIERLVSTSLVFIDRGGAEARYGMLEPIRQYALERLTGQGEERSLRERHAEYVLGLLERADSDFFAGSGQHAADRLRQEIDNVRAAVQWTLEQRNDPLLGAQIVGATRMIGTIWPAEALRWCDDALAGVGPTIPLKVEVMIVDRQADVNRFLGRIESQIAVGKRLVELRRRTNDAGGIARALKYLSWALVENGDRAEALATAQDALSIARVSNDPNLMAACLVGVSLCLESDQIDRRAELLREALEIARDVENDLIVVESQAWLGEIAYAHRRYEDAVASARESFEAARRLGADAVAAACLCNMTAYAAALDDRVGARDAARSAIAMGGDIPLVRAMVLQHLALVAVRDGDATRAARLLGFCDASLRRTGRVQRDLVDEIEYVALLSELREALGGEDAARLMREGAKLSEAAAIGLAQ
jgi:predicted ATPase